MRSRLLAIAGLAFPAVAAALELGQAPAPFDMREGCRPERRKETAEGFETTWAAKYANRVRREFANATGPSMLTIGDWRSNALFFNFIAHVNRTVLAEGLDFTVVNVALDPKGSKACETIQQLLPTADSEALESPRGRGGRFARRRERRMRAKGPAGKLAVKCVSLEGWLPSEFFVSNNREAGEKGTGTCAYNMIIWTKPHILRAAVESTDHGVLMIDTDVVVHKDIVKEGADRLARSKDGAIVMGTENGVDARVNTGTVFTKKGRYALETLDAWIEKDSDFLNDDHGDQAALQAVYNVNHRLRQFTVSFEDAVGQCARSGTVAIHYNCYDNKLAPMTRKGDWDVASQKAREKAGLFSTNDLSEVPAYIQPKIAAMEANGDWLVG